MFFKNIFSKTNNRSYHGIGLANWHGKRNYRKTSNISLTFVGNKIFDHSDVVGASPVSAAPTTYIFVLDPTRDSAKTAVRQYDNLLSVGIRCALYWRFDGTWNGCWAVCVTSTFCLIHDLDLVFSRSDFEITYVRNWRSDFHGVKGMWGDIVELWPWTWISTVKYF